jgi:hypothetical protein
MRTDQLAIAAIVAVFAATMFLATNLFLSTKSARAAAVTLDQGRKTNGIFVRHVRAERTGSVPQY